MTNRHDSLRTASAIAAAASLIATIGLSAPAAGRDAEESGAPGSIHVLEHETLPVPGLGPLTVHVWRRGPEVQFAALDNRGAMVVLRAGTIHDSTPDGTAAMRGRPSARIRFIGTGHTATVEEVRERALRACRRRARFGGRCRGTTHPVCRKSGTESRSTHVSGRRRAHRDAFVDPSLDARWCAGPVQVADSARRHARRLAHRRPQRSGVDRRHHIPDAPCPATADSR